VTASLLDSEPITCLERIEAILMQFVIAYWVIGVPRDRRLTERVTGKPVAPFVFCAGANTHQVDVAPAIATGAAA